MILDKIKLLKHKKRNLEEIKTKTSEEHTTNYVALPAYLWSFKDEPNKKRNGKRYVKNRKNY